MLPTIQKLLDHINSNLDRELTVEQMAQSVKLSRSRMHYLFRTQIGIPAIQYVKMRRLERARDLLQTTSLSVKEIRVRVGMQDRSHFARQFKKTYGMTPSQSRRAIDESLPGIGNERTMSENRTIGHEE
jgi:transcriptional regulator GlxA family with amidase domain